MKKVILLGLTIFIGAIAMQYIDRFYVGAIEGVIIWNIIDGSSSQ